MERKVAVNPCAGIGQVVGECARQAGYKVVDNLRKDKTVLVCMPALSADVQEDVDFIMDYPVVVIDGCKDRCGKKVVEAKGGKPARSVYIPDVIKKEKLSLIGEKRGQLGANAQKVIEHVANEVAAAVDELLNEAGTPE